MPLHASVHALAIQQPFVKHKYNIHNHLKRLRELVFRKVFPHGPDFDKNNVDQT